RLAGDPIPGAWPAGSPIRRRRLHIQLHQPGDFVLGQCPDMSCFALPAIDLSAVDTGWFDLEIPFDLSEWAAMDPCGGVEVRPVFYVTNDFGENQGGEQNRFALTIDDICLDGPVDTSDPALAHDIRLSPNPTNGELTLRFSAGVPDAARVQVLDLWGRVLQSAPLTTGAAEYQWSVYELPAGIYFVRILTAGRPRWIEKIVKH
ncbi:MAG: T9SS type A sorting domain-containing protein, partial [Lewinella sp.]|nr:T9SS type A sorting domain-containing protein [Lewinella sp.]